MCNLKHRNPHNTNIRDNYHNLTKKSKALLRTKQQCYFNDKLNLLTSGSNPKSFWDTLKTLKKDHNPEINNPTPVDKLYDHFSTLHSNSKDQTDPDAINFNIGTTYDPTTSDPLNKLDDPVSEIEIISATKKLKTKKAPGLYRIGNEMLKCGIHYLASSLSILFNTILKSGYLPASWS